MDQTLLLDFCVIDKELLVNTEDHKVGRAEIIFTPVISTKMCFYVAKRIHRKAAYFDTGRGRMYVINHNNKRKLITELKPVFGTYTVQAETDKHMHSIISEFKERKAIDDIFEG